MISAITPSHSVKHLAELYACLLTQSIENWEWIILLNGDVVRSDVDTCIRGDARVVIIEDTTGNDNIGYLKHRAFFLGIGDILVELDHDDIITPDWFEKVQAAFADPEIGFVYSDNTKLNETGKFIPYNKADADPMAWIDYMPDHLRAWRTNVYHQVGGHDRNQSVLADQDLIVRTYMVSKFHHIPAHN